MPEPALVHVWPQLDVEPLSNLERLSLRLGAGDEIQLILESRDSELVDFRVEELPLSAVHLSPAGALVLAGSDYLVMEVLGKPMRVSAGAFFQVNTAMAELMVQHVLEILPLESTDTLLDVFCGVGLFSIFIAPRVKRLVGIEVSPQACIDFAANLDEFENVELYEAQAEQVLTAVDFGPRFVLVDPPRSGLAPLTLDGLVRQQAERLVYVSCDPATLGRDAKRLVSAGYRLVQITPFDLFPQTYHIESISLWQK